MTQATTADVSALSTANASTSAPAGDGGLHNVTDLLTSGVYHDSYGVAHCIYPLFLFGDPYFALWPEQHTHYHTYPDAGGTSNVTLHNQAQPEKPHETVARALKEIAQATRALKESAEAMGVPVEAAALDEAIVERLRAAL